MKHEEIINKIRDRLLKYNKNFSLAIVGSAVNSDIYHDIDLLIAVDDIEKLKDDIKKEFFEYILTECDDAIKIENICEKPVSIAIYSKNNINTIVDTFLEGKTYSLTHRVWCLGYWIPESFIKNLKQMRIVYDNSNYYSLLKNRILNDRYASYQIIKECIEEITIKTDLMKNSLKDSVEYSFYKNDVILASLRGLAILNNDYIISFKRIDDLIKKYNSNSLNNFINGDIKSIYSILEEFKVFNSWSNRIYMGTWQFSGDFKNLSDDEIKSIIKIAKDNKIHQFDTALVYGKGKVEKILGETLEKNDVILTKVPAKIKPPKENLDGLDCYYDYDYIVNCIKKSLENLNRKTIDVCLLHNWAIEWNSNDKILNYLINIKKDGLASRVGISLPNNFDGELSDEVLRIIDVIEAPYNRENNWIVESIPKYKKYGIEIILRSLFMQGKEISSYENILNEAFSYQTSLVIGMTTQEQIENNIKVLERQI